MPWKRRNLLSAQLKEALVKVSSEIKNLSPTLMERQLQVADFISGKANRDKSVQTLINHLLDSYVPRKRKWMVLFPEGGFLRKRRAVSQRFAEKNNLPILYNVSLPRVGALKAIMSTVGPTNVANNNSTSSKDLFSLNNKLTWVLDITIAYPNGEPLDLGAIIFGYKPPCKTTLFYRLYSSKDIPQDDEAQSKWLYNLFEEKDHMLDTFYKTGKFPVTDFVRDPVQPHIVAQDCLRFLVLHLFFITSTYVHVQMFLAAYEYYNYLMY